MQPSEIEKLREALDRIKSIVCGSHFPGWADNVTVLNKRLRITDICDAALSPSPEQGEPKPVVDAGAPIINIRCEFTDNLVSASTYLNVIRVETEDDGSFTVVTDHWPVRTPQDTPRVSEDGREAERYAERLARVLYEKHWKNDVPQWKPLTGDLIGILTQIDNMTAGLARLAPPSDEAARLREEVERLTRERDEANDLAERSTRRLVELSAPGTLGAFATRDAALARAEAAEARLAQAERAGVTDKAEGAIAGLKRLKADFNMRGANATTLERAIQFIREAALQSQAKEPKP